MRLHVTGNYQGEYMYMIGNSGLIMSYKEYTVQKTKQKNLKNDKAVHKR